MGFFQAIYGLGMFIGPIFVGSISDLAGLDMGFWMIGSIGILGAVITKLYSKGSVE
jgi:MFS family permease